MTFERLMAELRQALVYKGLGQAWHDDRFIRVTIESYTGETITLHRPEPKGFESIKGKLEAKYVAKKEGQ